MTTNIRILLLLLLLPPAAFLLADAADAGSSNSLVQWQILSKLNYSSQIRLHPHLLLLVTVPWSGESRSLMKELIDVVSHDQGRFASLKLMVLYRSSERIPADAVGADEGITIFYHHHSHSYKYMGRLRVQNILSSVHYAMSLLPEQLPFKILQTPEDIEIFLGSTDKALILSEFCGWAQKLLATGGNNSSECDFGILWTGREPEINHNMNSEAPFKYSPHEITLQEGSPTLDVKFNQIRALLSSSAKAAPRVVVGSVLVATEKLLNVHPFDGSKVLIVKVDQSTRFQGLIVNKHISWDSLDELEDGVQLLKEAPLSFGGPVMKRGMPFVAFSRKYIVNQSMEVLPNVFLLDQRATVGIIKELRLGNQPIHDLWFFLGFSSWGWGQLFDEIAEGAWIVRNHDEEQIDWAWR